MDADVVVVGAGLAGLSAASVLVSHEVSVRVLEARDRVGGRTLSRPVGSRSLDLGGQWMGPGQPRIGKLARELGVRTFPTYVDGKKIVEIGDSRMTHTGGLESALALQDLANLKLGLVRTDWMRKQIPLAAPQSAKRALEWDGAPLETFKRKHFHTRTTRGLFDVAVRSLLGAEPREVSLLSFLHFLQSGGGLERLIEVRGGAQQDRFDPNAHALALGLAARLGDRIEMSSPVRAILHDRTGVTIQTRTQSIRAKRAIVAIPPILVSRIDIDPALPAGRRDLAARMPMGAMVKCVVAYERPFWRDLGFSGEVVTTVGPMSVVYDDTSFDRAQPALVALVGGQAAREWSARPETDRRSHLLDTLARFFGPEARFSTDFVEQDWSLEPYSAGCPLGLPSCGALTTYPAVLREPVGALHFAGTETAFEWAGYMEGALESGHRAAHEALARLS